MTRFATQTDRRAAFTLMEVLAALALSALLFSCVFHMINRQAQARVKGENLVGRIQRHAAMIADLTADLRLIPGDATVAGSSITPSTTSSLLVPASSIEATHIETTRITEQILDVADARLATPIRFWGTSETVVFEMTHPNRRFDPNRAANGQKMLVVWWCHQGKSPRVPLTRRGTQLSFTSVRMQAGVRGLLRWTAPLSTLISPDVSNSMPKMIVDESMVVCEEISSLRWRYFDGQAWRTKWDSEEQQALPVAIEVTVQSSNPDESFPVVIRLPQAARGVAK